MSSLNQKEIDHFTKDSSYWWDEEGPFKPLHRLNPVRIEYLRNQIEAHYPDKKISDISILDVGCGGGLVCEPFSRIGAKVTGLDADLNAIEVAKEHANAQELSINYQAGAIEEIEEQYDVVFALEIIEHVSDAEAFVQAVLGAVKPGGLAVFSTLNRTYKSYALGIIAAEHLLRWVPRGTHSWRQFVKPSELSRYADRAGGQVQNITGLVFNPLQNRFELNSSDVDVNYLISIAIK
jgi:2-polyprenyl-6-hydroxyphenyl methylase / 3-demethylubiquinone-9 3-methyltransferase